MAAELAFQLVWLVWLEIWSAKTAAKLVSRTKAEKPYAKNTGQGVPRWRILASKFDTVGWITKMRYPGLFIYQWSRVHVLKEIVTITKTSNNTFLSIS